MREKCPHVWQLGNAMKAIHQICDVLVEADMDRAKVKVLRNALKRACNSGINAACLANAFELGSVSDLEAVKKFLEDDFEDLVEDDKAPW